jgi:hypothetical protein
MTARGVDTAGVALAALVVTMVVAAPVLRAPSERIFGKEIVGRHYDPFTVMEQFNRPIGGTALLQPLTDVPGAWLAKSVGAVASYNAVVLVSFPLGAVAAYLLARHLAIPRAAALVVAFAFAFSPFHLAHAAYHPHIAQVQWLPLYLLALWRCLDRATWRAAGFLAAAAAGITFSNFYGGLMAAVISPVAIGGYWFFKVRPQPGSLQRLMVTLGTLCLVAAAVGGYAFFLASIAAGDVAGVEFARRDLFKYSATWSSYLGPPAAHPLAGAPVPARGATFVDHPALLERQLSLGLGLMGLSVVAVVAWIRARHSSALLAGVPVLGVVAIIAFISSFAPTAVVGSITLPLPASVLYDYLPMFRSYARFGSIVQLMVALLAGIGVAWLWLLHSRRAQLTTIALIMLAAAEYAIWPPDLWRDVLPTSAHRWATRQPQSTRVLDCHPHTSESQSVQWLTGGRVILRSHAVADCREPGVIAMLAATGFTHLLVRRHSPEGQWFEGRTPPPGLRAAARFDDAQVFEVTARRSLIRTVQTHAFYPLEVDAAWTWRWMGAAASWTVVNSSERSLMASVDVETNAFHGPRRLTVVLNGVAVQEIVVEGQRAIRRLGPFALHPGDQTVMFRAATPPTVADDVIHNGDRRPLSIAFGDWHWSVDGERP